MHDWGDVMSTVVSMRNTSDHAAACGRADGLAREWRLEKLLDDARLTGSPVGQSPAWCEVLRRAIQVAATDTTTCLQGESGVGKEVVARFIHRASPRRRGPFVAINCAALPEQLLESELFGYERGAFTGAQQSKPGQIELPGICGRGDVVQIDTAQIEDDIGAFDDLPRFRF